MMGKCIDKWQYMYDNYKFAKENPNSQERMGSGKLASWLASQKIKYKEGKLTQYQITALEKIGVDFNIQPKVYENNWDEACRYLEDYFTTNGNIGFTNTYVTENGYKLGRWIINQRAQYSENKLSLERINKLNSMYMIWSVRDNNLEIKTLCEKYHIFYSINKDRMKKLPVSRLEYMINYLIDRDIAYVDNDGYLLDIIFVPYIEIMDNINNEDDYTYMLKR